ncbi:MAG: DsbA family oxidoreductase [Gammaproteobacteria bacterium]
MPANIRVDVVSDMVCPYCYLGKRRLEKAIAGRPDLNITVNWRPFQLSPDMPREGRDRLEHYEQLFGNERAKQIMESMQDTGMDDGIAFDYRPGARSPNTLAAHVLMRLADENSSVDMDVLAEKLFYAHHVDCDDIGDLDVLMRIAKEVGMDVPELRARLRDEEIEALVTGQVEEARGQGVSGVPFFIINGRYGISGAQPADSLMAAFDQIASSEDGQELSE